MLILFTVLTTTPVQLLQHAKAQQQQPLDKIINIPAGHVDYFTFSVAQDAVNPRLTGTYEVHGGIIPAVNVYIGTTTQCPDPSDPSNCSGAFTDSGKSLGQIDVALIPGSTYYIIFENIAPLGESKQVSTHLTLTG
jgi:hypothetical protein